MHDVFQTQAEGTIYSFAKSPDFARDNLYFAASSSGLYRSADGGQNWCLAYDSLNLTTVLATTAVAFSPDFAADRSLFAAVPGHILRSTDGGYTWRAAAVTTPAPQISALVVSPHFIMDGTLLLATLEDGIFRSTDRGEHWSSGNFGLLDLSVNCIAISPDFANDETLFVGTQTGLFFSKNGGLSWRELNMPTGYASILSIALSPSFGQDRNIFVGTDSLGLYRSDDHGLSWFAIGGAAVIDAPINQIVLSSDFHVQPEVFVVLSDRLLFSPDSGQTWTDWQIQLAVKHEFICAAFPQGFAKHRPALIGQVEAGVLQII